MWTSFSTSSSAHAERQAGAPEAGIDAWAARPPSATPAPHPPPRRRRRRRRLGRRDIGAAVGERDGRQVAVAVIEADAHRPDRAGPRPARGRARSFWPARKSNEKLATSADWMAAAGASVAPSSIKHFSERRALGDRQHRLLDAELVRRLVEFLQLRDVLRPDRDGERGKRVRLGAAHVEARRIDVGERGDLDGPVGKRGGRFAHARLDLRRLGASLVVVRTLREIDGLDLVPRRRPPRRR